MALRGSTARRYAESVFAIARENDSFDRWLEDTSTIASVFGNPDMRRFLDDPKPSLPDKETVIRKLLDSRVGPLAVNLAVLLVRREQGAAAAGIQRELQRLVNDHRNIAAAEVTTAVELDARQRELVKERLEVLTAKKIELSTRIDKSIIGGFVARVGDVLIDASLATRLATLRQDLLSHTA